MCVCVKGLIEDSQVDFSEAVFEVVVLRKLWCGAHDFEDFWKKLSRNAFSGLLIGPIR